MMKCVCPNFFAFMKEAPIARLILAFIGVLFLVAVYMLATGLLLGPFQALSFMEYALVWRGGGS
jgi:hypothetical protein